MNFAGGEHRGIFRVAQDEAPRRLWDLLLSPSIEALEIGRPPVRELRHRNLVAALLGCPGLKLDFRGQAPEAVLRMAVNQLIGNGAFVQEQAMFAQEIAQLESFTCAIVGSHVRPQTSIRTYFAPGDLVWHVDRVNERKAVRLLWPIGRPAGMCVTPADNLDMDLHRAYMRREHPLLSALDTRVLRTGLGLERLWAHRPEQVRSMVSGHFPFIHDPARVFQIDCNAISIHRVETPVHTGTYHRSCWDNHISPGLQIVITAAAE